jgi:predicted AlkP superfamily phosphohydrolase/phosphomutase
MPPTSTHPAQLLIGLDAMEWTLVRRGTAEGKLPVLKQLTERGLTAQLSSSAESLADTAWPALCCGVNPGKLRKYFYVQYDPSTAELRYMNDSAIAAKPFWHYLDEVGRVVAIVDVPHLPFHELVRGFSLSQWGSHDNLHKTRTSPPSLLQQIESTVGKHPIPNCEKYSHNPRGFRTLRQGLLDGVRAHGRLFRWFMKTCAWNLFLCFFRVPLCRASFLGTHGVHRTGLSRKTALRPFGYY